MRIEHADPVRGGVMRVAAGVEGQPGRFAFRDDMERVDDAGRAIDAANAVVAGVNDVDVPLRIESEAARVDRSCTEAEAGVDRGATIARKADGSVAGERRDDSVAEVDAADANGVARAAAVRRHDVSEVDEEKIVAVGGHPGRAGDAGVLRRTAVPAVAAICVSCEGGDDAVRVDAADLAAVDPNGIITSFAGNAD